MHISIPHFFVLQLECEYDRVVVYHKRSGGQLKKHGSYCGPHPPPLITSEGNALRIEFYSDLSVQKSGFAAVFLTGNFFSIIPKHFERFRRGQAFSERIEQALESALFQRLATWDVL